MQEQSYTAIPNHIVDEIMRELTASEFCLFMVVTRKTIGWQKDQDAISISQFMAISGQSKPTVLKALKGLQNKELLRVMGDKAQTKIYALSSEILNLCHSASKETLPLASKETLHPSETTSKESLRTSKETLPLASKETLHTIETTKETIQNKEYIGSKPKQSNDERLISEIEIPPFVTEQHLRRILSHRRAIKKPIRTPKAISAIAKKLSARPDEIDSAIDLIEEKEWQSFEWEWFDKSRPKQSANGVGITHFDESAYLED